MRNELKFRWKRLLLCLVLILPLVGIAYEYVCERLDRKYAPPGKLIPVNEHDMHIFSKGAVGLR
jgi:hypothetical protein